MSHPHKGNAIIDGYKTGGWIVGNKPSMAGLFKNTDVFIKYGLHHNGDECKQPYQPSSKINVSILVYGGPFMYSFKDYSGNDLSDQVLEKPGDYVIYGTNVTHTWKALRESTVITVQFTPEKNDPPTG
jgi:hypothetical protein